MASQQSEITDLSNLGVVTTGFSAFIADHPHAQRAIQQKWNDTRHAYQAHQVAQQVPTGNPLAQQVTDLQGQQQHQHQLQTLYIGQQQQVQPQHQQLQPQQQQPQTQYVIQQP
ncbi:hypothetical protein ACHAPA_011919 [Fusarium lateritium]